MGLVQPVWRDEEDLRPTRERPVSRPDPGAAFEREALEMNGRELVPMAGVVLVVGAILALLLVYLTAFGRMTAQGARAQQLGSEIQQLRAVNTGLAGDVAELSRKERIEQEAWVLGLQPVGPAETHAFELPAGAVDPSEAAAASRHAQLIVP
jgi:cell division protein FtsL